MKFCDFGHFILSVNVIKPIAKTKESLNFASSLRQPNAQILFISNESFNKIGS